MPVLCSTQSCQILCNTVDCGPPGSSVHGDSPGKNIRVGCHAPLRGMFPAQVSNPVLPHCRWILYCLSHEGCLEYCSGEPIASPGDLSNPVIEPSSPTLQADSLLSEPWGCPWILEWGAHPFSRGSSQSRNWIKVSCMAGIFIRWATREAHKCVYLWTIHLLLEIYSK